MNLSDLTPTIAADRLELYANERRLVQGAWHKDGGAEGRELACMLGSFHADINSPDRCPAQVMPEWCARLVVTLFDGIPSANIFDTSKRFAAALRKTEGFTTEQWNKTRRKFLHTAVGNALEAARKVSDKLDDRGKAAWEKVQAACGEVLLQLGQDKDPDKASARWAAEAAAEAAEARWASARWAAEAARWAAEAAAEAAEAAEAATAARWAATAARWAAEARWAARRSACQDLFDALISSIEAAS